MSSIKILLVMSTLMYSLSSYRSIFISTCALTSIRTAHTNISFIWFRFITNFPYTYCLVHLRECWEHIFGKHHPSPACVRTHTTNWSDDQHGAALQGNIEHTMQFIHNACKRVMSAVVAYCRNVIYGLVN